MEEANKLSPTAYQDNISSIYNYDYVYTLTFKFKSAWLISENFLASSNDNYYCNIYVKQDGNKIYISSFGNG